VSIENAAQAAAGTAGPPVPGHAHTGSRATRVLGAIVLAGTAVILWLSFIGTPPDAVQGEAVRLLYVHVPSVTVAYLACGITFVASAVWLRKRSEWWDLVASSAAEIAMVFTAVTLLSGMVWGEITWGTPWEWDPRLTSTLFLFLLLVGYQALRAASPDRAARARRAAVVGLLLVPNIVIVNRSVTWWRSLHQDATLFRTDLDFRIEGLMLFTWVFATAIGVVLMVWLLIHRFRVGWLANRLEERRLDDALVARRAEGAAPAGGETAGGGA
jgi:heme exporter protein C